MSTEQEYWDACLIRTWRNGGTRVDALTMFKSITGKNLNECNLLRSFPEKGFKYAIRPFVAARLPKISEWLFKHPPERDVDLLRKLSKSTYTTLKSDVTVKDKEFRNKTREHKTIVAKNIFTMHLIASRNNNTNGNVVKGARSRTR